MSGAFNARVGKAVRALVLALLTATQVAGCTDELSGPGTFLAVVTAVEGVAPGAVVVELEGGEFTQVLGVGATETFHAESSGGESESGPLRVVVVGWGGPLTFEVRVADFASGAPKGAVVQAVSLDNKVVSADRYRVALHVGR